MGALSRAKAADFCLRLNALDVLCQFFVEIRRAGCDQDVGAHCCWACLLFEGTFDSYCLHFEYAAEPSTPDKGYSQLMIDLNRDETFRPSRTSLHSYYRPHGVREI